jgi:glycosyltransferase involved in cell wall biosynthesis
MIGAVPTGLGTYATELVRALVPLDPTNTYLVIRGPQAANPVRDMPHVEEVILGGDLDTPRNLFHGPAISRLKLDLYHSLHHFLPLGLRVPRVVMTLHDLIWLEHADLIIDGRFGAAHRIATHLFARAAMGRAVRRADHIISISGHTRARALAYYRLNPSRISVVHHGVDHRMFARAARRSPAQPYFVGIGNTRPYKNMGTAIEAFALATRVRPDLELVIAGRGDSVRSLRPLADRLGVGARVRFAGLLEQDDLLTLLHGAAALIFPSHVEGFGLPVLEAMAAGCPVIASRIPTLVEITNGATLVCDPGSPAEFAAAMLRLLSDEPLRMDLARRGCVRAAAFSWDRCAAGTLAVYRQLL